MGEHLVQFYNDDAYLVEEIWNFISAGLQLGEAAVVIATRERLEHIERLYAPSRLVGIDQAEGGGPYIALDAESVLASILKDGRPDAACFDAVIGEILRKASRNGVRHVRAYGEMVASLCTSGKPDAAIALEDLWNGIGMRYPLSLLCGYPMHAFPDEGHCESFSRICSAHSHVRPAEHSPEIEDGDGLNRTIAALQQKANALESEVARRRSAEQSMHRREKELDDFLESAFDGMHRVGPDGRVLWANTAALNLLGYARDEYIGRHVSDFHADRAVIESLLARLRAGETLYNHPARMRCRDGSIKHVLIRSGGCIAGTHFLMRDVTERVRLDHVLNTCLDQLAELERRKDEFLAMLGHELRNPLAPIVNSLELMRLQSGSPEHIARYRETIARQVSLMTRLVDDLLDVSRITRGKIALKKEATTLDLVVERAVEIVRPLIDERGHRLHITLPPAAMVLTVDPVRLSQALANLLHNAAKFTEFGARITLVANMVDGKLEIVVGDNGAGIDKAAQEKIFDLFVQLADTLSDARGGLGIGLTLARCLVRLHGGDVRVRSEGRGRGSEFTITLPLPAVAEQ